MNSRKSRRIAAISALLYLVLIAVATAQMPRTISYQGVLARADGSLLADGSHTLTLSLYESPVGGAPIFTETQTVTAVRGMFNIIIGSGSGSGLPESLSFDRAYFLGVSVDGSSELTPRTPLTAVPYALHANHSERATTATHADTAMTLAGGAVTSVNGMQGSVTIKGDGGTTVSMGAGNEVIVSSQGGSGIQELMGSDGTIGVVNATGPVSDLQVLEGSIRTSKLQDWAVTTPKLAPNAVDASKIQTYGAEPGRTLISDGSQTPVWGDPIGLNLPHSAVVDAPRPVLSLTNSGDAPAAQFVASKESSQYPALFANSYGIGSAIIAYRYSTSGSLPTISGISYSNDDYTPAITGTILSSNPGIGSSGVLGSINSPGTNGAGVWGRHDGGGIGVQGTSLSGTGVRAHSSSGYGVYATSNSGFGGYFITSDSSNAGLMAINTSRNGDAIRSSGHVVPVQAYAYDLGTGSRPWRSVSSNNIYANNVSAATVSAGTFSGNGTIPVGGIIIWSGSINNIPAGWRLCNGQNGTPDLRSRFIVGAGSPEYAVGDTGGAATHSHIVNPHTHSIDHNHPSGLTGYAGSHSHDLVLSETYTGEDDTRRLSVNNIYGAELETGYEAGHRHTFDVPNYVGESGPASPGTSSASNVPPYYALAFIMRVQ
jgi:hypothetical protein